MFDFNPNFKRTMNSPVMEAGRWASDIRTRTNLKRLNLAQAAPAGCPHPELRDAIAQAALRDPSANAYGPVLGDPELRCEVAHRWSRLYNGCMDSTQVAITSGCNQAFTAAISVLAQAGNAVMITAPWYFNHKMWLDMMGIEARILNLNEHLRPDLKQARKLWSDNLKAIVLISPNNPCGTEYDPGLIRQFYELAREHGIKLILDETYRDFISPETRLHDLFGDADWPHTLIHLYSFSKAYRLMGHRVGCMIAGEDILTEVEKYLDTVAICPNQLAQTGALYGLKNLASWLAEEKKAIQNRARAIKSGFAQIRGWKLLCCGAYFAYVRHPFAMNSEQLAKMLLRDANILLLPDTMFENKSSEESIREYGKHVRIAFANVDMNDIAELFRRLQQFTHANKPLLV